jgi:S1-C subfamily serine protease
VNFLDLVVLLAAAGAGWIGYRLGLLVRLLSWAGLTVGIVLGVAFVDDVVRLAHNTAPRARLLIGLAFLVLSAVAGQAVGFAASSALWRLLGRHVGTALRRADRWAGAAAATAGVLVVFWLMIPALASAPGWSASAVRRSAVARVIHGIAPHPPSSATALGRLVGDESFPEVFDTLTSPDAGSPPRKGLADPEAVKLSVVRVVGTACDVDQQGTGFVVGADNIVVTNAHVVAGERTTRVLTYDGGVGIGRDLPATVVAFDPNRDLAVLFVPQLTVRSSANALDEPLARATGATGTTGSLFGFPNGGPLTEAPMRIHEQVEASGTNIERNERTKRQVFVIAAITAPGDSGGPLVDRHGNVVGVLFALDVVRRTTAYALTGAEIDAVLGPVVGAAANPLPPVPTGSCLTG